MKLVGRHGRHGLRMRFEPNEAEVLGDLFDQLDTALDAADGADDPVVQRLYPAAYRDDGEAEAEFRSLTEDSLRTERHDRVAACRADLLADGGAHDVDVDLADPDVGRRWIQVLNDLRLAIGTRIGITEDDDHDVDPDDPEQQPRVVYYWLTSVQDTVVTALMR